MGTNYFLRKNICKCCDRYDEQHIGKKSFGWQFTFFLPEEYDLCRDYLVDIQSMVHLGNAKIFNEYGEEVSFNELKDTILDKDNGTKVDGRQVDELGVPYHREWFV
jgi:hypothetical protein